MSKETMKDRFDKEFKEGDRNSVRCKAHDVYATPGEIIRFINSELQRRDDEIVEITEDTSDGYHTFKELYEFRKIYNALVFNEWYMQDKYRVHKSKKHSDGEDCFGGGWFIVMATLSTGQISNHYELKDWDLFRCVAYDKAEEFDGHTAKDVKDRIINSIKER